MAKHPHKLLLVGKKTWKCQIEGCAFFVHLGLAHILVNKRAVCWNCEEVFSVDEDSLKDEKPKCMDCRLALNLANVPDNEPIVTPENGRTPEQQREYEKQMAQMFGKDWRKMLGGGK